MENDGGVIAQNYCDAADNLALREYVLAVNTFGSKISASTNPRVVTNFWSVSATMTLKGLLWQKLIFKSHGNIGYQRTSENVPRGTKSVVIVKCAMKIPKQRPIAVRLLFVFGRRVLIFDFYLQFDNYQKFYPDQSP